MTIVGDGDYRYELLPEWPKKMPESWKFGMASDVAVDSKDRVWVFAREQHPVTWWTTDGELVGSWGYGLTLGIAPDFFFREPHGIFIDSDDNIWLIRETASHRNEAQPVGRNLDGVGGARLGGCDGHMGWSGTASRSTRLRALLLLPTARFMSRTATATVVSIVSRPMETYEMAWGIPGGGPGEFALVHNVGVDDRRPRLRLRPRKQPHSGLRRRRQFHHRVDGYVGTG